MKRIILNQPGGCHFITFSTHQRRRFLDSEQIRNLVLESLQNTLQKHQAHCHGFVIMPNHVHAILSVSPEKTISSFLQAWKKTSSYNIKHFFTQNLTQYQAYRPDSSPIWQARFYDHNIESDQKFLEKLAYMHTNPVTAGLAPTILDWPWSSARYYELNENVGVTITPSN